MATATATATGPAKKPNGKQKPLPAPNSDFYELKDILSPDELAIVRKVRTFMESKVAPIINK
jgi:hypothetical protein